MTALVARFLPSPSHMLDLLLLLLLAIVTHPLIPIDSVLARDDLMPWATAVLAAAARREGAQQLLGFFVRKQAKSHGLGRRLEGAFREGQTVALVEDTTTTGGSTLEAVDAVHEAGGKVARVLCLVDRGEGARDAFAQRGIELEALFDRSDLPV